MFAGIAAACFALAAAAGAGAVLVFFYNVTQFNCGNYS